MTKQYSRGGSYSHVFTLHLYACRDGSCAIRGSSGVFFCGSWSSSSCLLIGSVWLLHHMGGEGWDGVMLVQYCIRPEVEIILFAIIAVKHLISHRTLSHTNIPALGFERRGKTSKNNSGVAVCMLIFLFKIWLWLFGLIMSYWCSHNGPKEPMNIINKRQHCAFYRKKKNLRNSYSSHSLRGCLVSSLPAIMQTLESFHVGIRVHVSS